MEQSNVVFYNKTSYEINIYRFYETGEVCAVNYEESLRSPIKDLAKGATINSFNKYKLPIGKFTYDENKLTITLDSGKGYVSHEGEFVDANTLKMRFKTKKGGISEKIYLKLGTDPSFFENL